MKKFLPSFLMAALLIASAASSHAQEGTTYGAFGYGIELTGIGTGATNNGTTELYALDNGGTTRLKPTGSTANLDSTDWTPADTQAAPNFNLGSFNATAGDTLTLSGGSFLSFQNTGVSITSADLNYQIIAIGSPAGPFIQVNLPSNATNVNGMAGDSRFSAEGQTGDLLTGLVSGSYELVTYGNGNGTDGSNNDVTAYDNNTSNANFGATFTVNNHAVPEPSTWAMLAIGFGALIGYQRRSRH